MVAFQPSGCISKDCQESIQSESALQLCVCCRDCRLIYTPINKYITRAPRLSKSLEAT